MNVIVIPARSGSKRIKNKNIKILNNKPLITFLLDKFKGKKLKEKIFVSSDSNKIKNIVSNYKNINFVKRPKKLASDLSKIEEALIHVINKEKLKKNGWIITIQPNSPFINYKTVKKIINLTKNSKKNCIMTVSKNNSDFWYKDKNKNFVKRLFPKAPRNTQKRQPLFEENSAIYATRISYLLKTKKIFDQKNISYEISKIEGLDINDKLDFLIAESIIKNGYKI